MWWRVYLSLDPSFSIKSWRGASSRLSMRLNSYKNKTFNIRLVFGAGWKIPEFPINLLYFSVTRGSYFKDEIIYRITQAQILLSSLKIPQNIQYGLLCSSVCSHNGFVAFMHQSLMHMIQFDSVLTCQDGCRYRIDACIIIGNWHRWVYNDKPQRLFTARSC